MSDILWRNSGGVMAAWDMNSGAITSAVLTSGGVPVNPDPTWSIAGISDFNGDGSADLLWRNTSGEVATWLMNGNTITSGADVTSGGVAVRPDATWSVAGTGDFNGDGTADILWRNTSGELTTWLMNGNTIIGSGDADSRRQLPYVPTRPGAWPASVTLTATASATFCGATARARSPSGR